MRICCISHVQISLYENYVIVIMCILCLNYVNVCTYAQAVCKYTYVCLYKICVNIRTFVHLYKRHVHCDICDTYARQTVSNVQHMYVHLYKRHVRADGCDILRKVLLVMYVHQCICGRSIQAYFCIMSTYVCDSVCVQLNLISV